MDPAFISIGRGGRGELTFGVVNASLDLSCSRTMVFFTFEGFDEGDEVNGSGSAELLDNGALARFTGECLASGLPHGGL